MFIFIHWTNGVSADFLIVARLHQFVTYWCVMLVILLNKWQYSKVTTEYTSILT